MDAVSLVAVRPGIDWMIRKIATAASVTRIIDPAARAVPENQRSPGRCLTLTAGAVGGGHVILFSVRVCVRAIPGPVACDRAGHRGPTRTTIRSIAALTWLALSVGDRRAAGGSGRGLLALGAVDVLEEALDERRELGVDVLFARDHVADEDDRVDAGLFRGAVERDGEVTLGAALFERRGVDDRRSGLGRERHELVADLHRDGAEALSAARDASA